MADKDIMVASELDGIGTWWWYNHVEITEEEVYNVSFTSNDVSYSKITFGYFFSTGRIVTTISYDSTRVYLNNNGVYNWEGGNGVSKFQYIKFDTAPPSDLLAKLQSNATYQGGTTPTTPTFLDEQGLRALAEKTKAYIDSRTTYRMTDVVENADSIDFTIVAETGGGS